MKLKVSVQEYSSNGSLIKMWVENKFNGNWGKIIKCAMALEFTNLSVGIKCKYLPLDILELNTNIFLIIYVCFRYIFTLKQCIIKEVDFCLKRISIVCLLMILFSKFPVKGEYLYT